MLDSYVHTTNIYSYKLSLCHMYLLYLCFILQNYSYIWKINVETCGEPERAACCLDVYLRQSLTLSGWDSSVCHSPSAPVYPIFHQEKTWVAV